MRTMLPIHVIAGARGIISGFIALFVVKGATVHRRSGTVFVTSMVAMAMMGATIAAFFRPNPGNVIAGTLTTYLVITAFTTVRERTATVRRLEFGAMLVAIALGLTSLTIGFDTLGTPTKVLRGIPAGVFLMFGTVALLSGIGDVWMIRAGGRRGPARLVRHLWRMSYALWIAALSFFIGQMRVIPQPFRIVPLLVIPPLVVLVAMLYWLWKVRVRKTFQGIVRVRLAEAA